MRAVAAVPGGHEHLAARCRGNGYIRTQFASVAETALGTSVGVWQSPAFTYKGNNGHAPATVKLNLNMRTDLGALLGVDLLTTPAIASTSWHRMGA